MKNLGLLVIAILLHINVAAQTDEGGGLKKKSQCNTLKKDGQKAARQCDLPKLCFDWVFYKRRIAEAKKRGEEDQLPEYQKRFAAADKGLQEYPQEQVKVCLDRIEAK